MKIAVLHNRRPAELPKDAPDDAFEEYDSPETIAAITRAIAQLDAVVTPVDAGERMIEALQGGGFDFVFNIAEGTGRRCREAVPAAICEYLGMPYSGSDPLTLAVTLDKWMARRVVSPDVPVAAGVLFNDDADLTTLRFPVIVKPNDEGSSKGIRDGAVCLDRAAAIRRALEIQCKYGCPVLIEEFLPGAEITVAVRGNGSSAVVLGAMEISPAVDSGEPFVYSVEVKRDYLRQVCYHVPPRLSATHMAEVGEYALTAYRLLGCRDFARMDFRLDATGEPRFLECNPLPGLNPLSSDLVILSRGLVPYEKLVQGILLDAMARAGIQWSYR
jgi:D-alanine-D-alanine ligase